MSEVLNFPVGWTVAKVHELAELLRGINYKKEQASNYPKLDYKPILRATNIQGSLNFDELVFVPMQNISEKQLIKAGDVIFAMSSGSKHLVGKSAQSKFDFDGSYGAFCAALRPANLVSKSYVYYVFQGNNFRRLISEIAKGTNINNLKREHILDFEIALPPLAEQHRIVAKIEELFSELDNGIENLKTAQQQLKIYRQALLKHAFEGKLTAQWREQNKDKLETAEALLKRISLEREQRYEQQLVDWEAAGKQCSKPKAPKLLPPLTTEELAELSELPVGWCYVRAEQISGFITKGTTPSKELLLANAGDIPFIKVYNLTKTGYLDFSIDPTFVKNETHNGFLARSKVYPGDVLMNIVGPPLGKVSIVPSTYPEWNINQAIAIFRSTIISNRFLAAYLAHEKTVRSMMRKSKATAGQFNLTLEICRETLIPLCCANEQAEIELLIDAKLSEVDQLDQTITSSLLQAEALRQSILKKAFSGQLVAQDTNDEPASELMSRIRKEQLTNKIYAKS